MITIQPEIEILSTESYEDMLRRIEKIGRVCYKSEERIGEGTAEKFIAGTPPPSWFWTRAMMSCC